MKESIIKIDNDYMFLKHNEIMPDRKSLLFVHGLGESGLCYQEVFEDKRFDAYNLFVPDLIGYGRSSGSETSDYSFNSQVLRLWRLLEQYPVKELIVIGHSMGGDITTLLCAADQKGIIKKYVNIEGDITQFDVFISNDAVDAYQKGSFHEWHTEFMNSKVYETWGKNYLSCMRYYASLWFSRPEAFSSNALEIVARSNALNGEYKSEIGKIYCELPIPKIYCYGTESISPHTIRFLKENGLHFQVFDGAGHWLMIDKAEEFYNFLYSFIS